MKTTAANEKVSALTGIRFVAAAYVFIMHYGASFLARAGAPRPIATLLRNGVFGVSIFFVLSGFILAHAHPARFKASAQYRDYFIARLARIYPVYLFALVLALPVPTRSVPLTARSAVDVLAMVQSWTNAYGHSGYAWIMQAWTLSAELFFYLLFPFLINLLRRLGSPVLLALCVIDAAFMISAGTATLTPWTDFGGHVHVPAWPVHLFLPLARSGEFLFGMLLQTLVIRASPIARQPGTALCLAVTAAIAVLLSTARDDRGIAAATVLIGLLIALIYVSDNGFTRLLGCPALYLLGSASYALYLLQGPVHAYLRMFVPNPYGRLLGFPVTLAAAILVWRVIEEPARRSILSLRPRDTAQAVPSTEGAGQFVDRIRRQRIDQSAGKATPDPDHLDRAIGPASESPLASPDEA